MTPDAEEHRRTSVANPRFLNPPTLYKPPGYTHVVEATGPGRIVYIAGQLGLDVDGNVVGGEGDFRAQCQQTFENLKLALAAVGGRIDQIVKLNNYLLDMKHLPIFREVRDSYLPPSNKPASTTIQIPGLARPGALLEIEAVAILPARSTSAKATAKSAKRGSAKTSKAKASRSKRK
jgi:enamine deaminase RidA (YjgF/YER057c/UK114 family)